MSRTHKEHPDINYLANITEVDFLAEGHLGQVITFYSYKGGVGRSRALANVAYQIARKYSESNKKVLCIDFDLEAPGLHKYFHNSNNKPFDPENQYGLLDMLCDYRDYLLLNSPYVRLPDWNKTIVTFEFPKSKDKEEYFNIDFMGPGRQSESYGKRLADFDWGAFYSQWFGGSYLDYLRRELRKKYQFILIDSRTGESDIGGICTIQLPTILVVVFTSSPQSTDGIARIIPSIQKQYRNIRNGKELSILPLPSKIDRTVEDELYKSWFQKLVEGTLGELMRELVGEGNVVSKLNEIMTLYYPWYTFNDTLESYREDIKETAANAWRYRNLLDLIETIENIPIRRSVDSSSVATSIPYTGYVTDVDDVPSLFIGAENLNHQIDDDFKNTSNFARSPQVEVTTNIYFPKFLELLSNKSDEDNEERIAFNLFDWSSYSQKSKHSELR